MTETRKHSGDLKRLSLKDIFVDNNLNPRTAGYIREELEEFAASIVGSKGLIQPVTVCLSPPTVKEETGKPYMLVAGFRRIHAIMLLIEDEDDATWGEDIPCNIRESSDVAELVKTQLIENFQRKSMSYMDIANAIKTAIERYKCKQSDFAKEIGMTKGGVSQYLKLAELPEDVQTMLENELISFSQARMIQKFPKDQWSKHALVAQGYSNAAFKKYCEELQPGSTSKAAADSDTPATEAEAEAAAAEVEAEAAGTQKNSNSMRPTTVDKEYLPYLIQQSEKVAAEDPELKAKIDNWADALTWSVKGQSAGGTELAEFLKAYEEEKKAKQEEERQNSEASKKAKEYLTGGVKMLRERLDSKNYGYEADGVTEKAWGLDIPKLEEVLTMVEETCTADFAKTGDDYIGFTLPINLTFKHDESEEHVSLTSVTDIITYVHEKYRKDKIARAAVAEKRRAELAAKKEKEAADANKAAEGDTSDDAAEGYSPANDAAEVGSGSAE